MNGADVKIVINLHGSIYHNHCQRCGKTYSVDYIRQAKKVPYCEVCGGVIRPGCVVFLGEMLDSENAFQNTGRD